MHSSDGMASEKTALAYKESVEGIRNGETLDVLDFLLTKKHDIVYSDSPL